MSTPPAPAAVASAATPRRLRQFQVLVVILMILLGVGSFWVLVLSRDSLALASGQAAEYVRLTTVSTRLLQADAAAGKAFLSDGRTAARHHKTVSDALGEAATLLVEAAAAQPADAEVLGSVSAQVSSYGRALEGARNLSDSDAGTRALLAASTSLREEVLPSLSDLAGRSSAQAKELLSQQYGWLLPVFAWLCVAALVAVSWAVARKSHRIVNLGLAGAVLAAGAIAVLSGSAISAVTGSAITARDGDLAQLQAATSSQNHVADAHGVETQGVLAQARAARYQGTWEDTISKAEAALEEAAPAGLLDALEDYTSAHAKLAGLTAEGRWEEAAALVSDDARTSPGGAVAAFDDEVTTVQEVSGAAVVRAATGYAEGLLAQAVGTGALALVAAWLGFWGLGQRLQEYR